VNLFVFDSDTESLIIHVDFSWNSLPPDVTSASTLIVYIFYSPKTGNKIKKQRKQTQANLTNMQSFPNFVFRNRLKTAYLFPDHFLPNCFLLISISVQFIYLFIIESYTRYKKNNNTEIQNDE